MLKYPWPMRIVSGIILLGSFLYLIVVLGDWIEERKNKRKTNS